MDNLIKQDDGLLASKVKLGPVQQNSGKEIMKPAFQQERTGHNTYRPNIYRTSEGYLS